VPAARRGPSGRKTALDPYRLLPPEALVDYEDYRAFQGGTLAEDLAIRSPESVLAELHVSGLRGRGGGGFPAVRKWATLALHWAPRKLVVLNAAEGEPGSFKDRWLLRQNPYVVLEGLLLAAHVIGTTEVVLGIKRVFREEIERLEDAVHELVDREVLGGVTFEIVEGPDEYLLGEEKALINVIEGQGPFPREPHYPPYEVGPDATPGSPNPCLVNNVETFARAATIALHGGAGFAGLGAGETRGPLLVTLSGSLRKPGAYEVEAGRSLREVLESEGGGPPPGRTWVGALSGVAHPVLMAEDFDTPLTFEDFAAAGSGLGSSSFVVLDETVSLPSVARAVARFLAIESCGQCHACKLGLRTAWEELEAMAPPADRDHLRRVEEWARSAPNGNRCNLPVQGAAILPSLMEDFAPAFRDAGEPGRAFVLPKMLDYDPETHFFRLDRRYARKQLDWSFAPGVEEDDLGTEEDKHADSGGEETPLG